MPRRRVTEMSECLGTLVLGYTWGPLVVQQGELVGGPPSN